MQQLDIADRGKGVGQIADRRTAACDATQASELAAFVAAHGQQLLRFAFLLTGGDGPAAEDLPDDRIAQVLGCSRATVRSLIHRAMPKLREWLAEPDEAVGRRREEEP